MNIFEIIKNFINKITGKKNKLLLDSPKDLYNDFLDKEEIKKISKNIPKDLNELEKAYYIYIEIGKLVKKDPNFSFKSNKEEMYENRIDENYYGMCKSMSELYVALLKKEGINAECIKRYPDSYLSHVDTILKIDKKIYLVDMISDLTRIKTSQRLRNFGIDLKRNVTSERLKQYNQEYYNMLKEEYGEISSITQDEREMMDSKIGYSYVQPQFKGKQKGIYTHDVLKLLRNDMDNPETFKKYVLKDKQVSENDYLEYKLDYIFENVKNYTHFQGKMGYMEEIVYFKKLFRRLLNKEEAERIQCYIVSDQDGNEYSSIFKVISGYDMKNKMLYYVQDEKDGNFQKKSREEMKEILNKLRNTSKGIVGEIKDAKKIEFSYIDDDR